VAATVTAYTLPDEALREALTHVSASRTDARETADFFRGDTVQVLGIWNKVEADLQFRSWFGLITYKPNLTKRRYLEHMERTILLAGCDEATLNASGIDQRIEGGIYNPYNWTGRLLLEEIRYDVAPSFKRDMEVRSMASVVEALIAIRLYGSAHGGALPPSLEALAPDFLPEVPRDYFDGSAIRYSAEERVVWFPGRFKAAPPFARIEESKKEEKDWDWEEYRNVFFIDPPPP
jgi:hypothetical protein